MAVKKRARRRQKMTAYALCRSDTSEFYTGLRRGWATFCGSLLFGERASAAIVARGLKKVCKDIPEDARVEIVPVRATALTSKRRNAKRTR